METVGAQVPPEVKRATEAEAKRVGMTVSEWLRYQLRDLTDNEPRTLDEMEGDTATT
jgi:antitoxin component of RelBE/YafQ-DinJ toxin-antitoxin module